MKEGDMSLFRHACAERAASTPEYRHAHLGRLAMLLGRSANRDKLFI